MALLELDHKISFSFEKLYVPSLEITECELELVYNNKNFRIKYPVNEPTILNLDSIFTKDNKLLLFLLLRESKTKLRKVAVGKINIYKKYFLAKNYNIEKWVYLDINVKALQLDANSNSEILSAMTTTGKIYMKISLVNPPIEDNKILPSKYEPSVATTKTGASIYSIALKNNLKNLDNTRGKIMSNKTEKFRSITENTNEFLRNIKNNKFNALFQNDIIDEEMPEEIKYNDGLSDVSVSVIDTTEQNQVQVEKINSEIEETISQIKEVFESRPDELIPQDVIECKAFIKEMVDQINSLQQNYFTNLTTLSEINKRIKFQAKNYYERYKELKHQFKKEREDYNIKNEMLENEVKENITENTKLQNAYSDLKNEMLFFRTKAGLKIDSDMSKDVEALAIADVLNSLKDENDIFVGLTDSEKDILSKVLIKYEAPAPKEIKQVTNEENNAKNEINNTQTNEVNIDIERESFNKSLSENIENYRKAYNIRAPIPFNHIKDDKYEILGKVVTLIQQNGLFKVFDSNKFSNLNEYLSKLFPSTEKTSSNSNKKPTAIKKYSYMSNPLSGTIKNHVENMLEKKLKGN